MFLGGGVQFQNCHFYTDQCMTYLKPVDFPWGDSIRGVYGPGGTPCGVLGVPRNPVQSHGVPRKIRDKLTVIWAPLECDQKAYL